MSALPGWLLPDDPAPPSIARADIDQVSSNQGGQRRGRAELPLEWAGEIDPRLQHLWLIKDMLPDEGLAVLFGHPGTGKSSFAIDLGLHVAIGLDWAGRATRRGTVVYLGAEGQKGLRNRIAAFRTKHSVTRNIPFGLLPQSLNLFDGVHDQAALRRTLIRAQARFSLPIALVVIDTLAQTLGSGRENTDDLAVYANFCTSLASEFQCCVLLIHHRPKDSFGKYPRGHGSLAAAADTILLVEGRAERKVFITKQRDGEEGPLCRFTLRPVAIGQDPEGAQVCSVVLRHRPPAELDSELSGRSRGRVSSGPNIVFQALLEEMAAAGEPAPETIPQHIIGDACAVVGRDRVRQRAFDGLRTESDAKPDSLKKSVRRHEKALQASGKIGFWSDYMWPVE